MGGQKEEALTQRGSTRINHGKTSGKKPNFAAKNLSLCQK
jgi:hypothetical protein